MSDEFFLYDRITYTVMYFSRDVSLEFVSKLSSKRTDGSRNFFHSEYEKISNYRLTNYSRTVRIKPRYYFCITIKDYFDGGFLINPSDVYMITESIKTKVLPWFFSNKRVFSIIDDKLVISGEYKPYMYPQSEYKYLSMIPTIYQYDDGKFKEGVRMFINSQDVYVDMTIDDLLGFLHIISTTDMVSLAALLCNYVKTQPYGVNMGQAAQGLGVSAYRDTEFDSLPPGSANDFLSKSKTK